MGFHTQAINSRIEQDDYTNWFNKKCRENNNNIFSLHYKMKKNKRWLHFLVTQRWLLNDNCWGWVNIDVYVTY